MSISIVGVHCTWYIWSVVNIYIARAHFSIGIVGAQSSFGTVGSQYSIGIVEAQSSIGIMSTQDLLCAELPRSIQGNS